jgi:hypothetical protein
MESIREKMRLHSAFSISEGPSAALVVSPDLDGRAGMHVARFDDDMSWRTHLSWSEIGGVVRRTMRYRNLRSGHWFDRLVVYYLRAQAVHQAARKAAPVPDAERVASSEAVIRRACVQASLLGTGAAATSTAATVWTAQTEGWAAPLAVPLLALAVSSDMIGRALLVVGMSCELGHLFGVTFDPEEPGDLGALYGAAFGTARRGTDDDSGSDARLVKRIAHLDDSGIGSSIGSKLFGDSVATNVLPFISLPLSAVQSWQTMRTVGEVVRRYVRLRAALETAIADAHQHSPELRDVVLEGLWFLFNAGGGLRPEEAALLGHFLHCRPPEARRALLARYVEDESDWLTRLAKLPDAARGPMLRVLEIAAAAGTEVEPQERRILKHVADAVRHKLDDATLDAFARQFAEMGSLARQSNQSPSRAVNGRVCQRDVAT